MNLLSIFILGAAINSNNFNSGILLGKKNIAVSLEDHLIIAFMCGFFTSVATFIGNCFYPNLPVVFSNTLAAAIIFLYGLYLLLHKKELNFSLNVINIKKMSDRKLTLRSAIQLGSRSLTPCIVLGIGASFLGIDYVALAVSVIILGFLFIFLGRFIGKKYGLLEINYGVRYILGVTLLLLCVSVFL